MVNFEGDYYFGEEQQQLIKPILEAKFGMLKSNDRYSKYDFENESYYIEVKTRKNSYNTYPTTLLTSNKITKTDRSLIFIFNFTDGIYYIEYDEKIFNCFEKKLFSRINKKFDMKDYYYIPIDMLKKI